MIKGLALPSQTIKSENLVKYLNDEFSGSGTDDLAVTRLISSAY